MKTLEDFKHEVANENQYKNWNTLYITKQWIDIYKCLEDACERYIKYINNLHKEI